MLCLLRNSDEDDGQDNDQYYGDENKTVYSILAVVRVTRLCQPLTAPPELPAMVLHTTLGTWLRTRRIQLAHNTPLSPWSSIHLLRISSAFNL